MNLYSNFEAYGVSCRLVVEFDERATTQTGQFLHRVTAEVNHETLVERQEVAHSNLTYVVDRYRTELLQIAKIISDPESDEVVKWLRSNAFNFTDIGVRPTQLNPPAESSFKQPGAIDEY